MSRHALKQIPAQTRLHLYQVLGALVPILVAYGVIADTEAALWLGLAGAVLSVGSNVLAGSNVNKGVPSDGE